MKKAVLCVILMLSGIFAFGQNLRDYTLVNPYGNVKNADLSTVTRYAVYGDLQGGVPRQEGNIFRHGISFMPGQGLFFQMSAEQAQEFTAIRQAGDSPLILLTRTGRNRDSWVFTVDRFIPMSEVFGVSEDSLPRNLWGQPAFEIIQLYLNTGRADPDGRVARALGR